MCDLWCILDFQSIRFHIDGIVTVSLLCGFFGVLLVTTIDLLTKDHTQGKNLLLRNKSFTQQTSRVIHQRIVPNEVIQI